MTDPLIFDTIQRFSNLAKEHLSAAIQHNRHIKAYRSLPKETPNGADYSQEWQVLQKHVKPWIWGAGTAFVIFANFRISKHFTSGNCFIRNKTIALVSSNVKKNNHNNRIHSAEKQLSYLQTLPLDLMSSILFGISAALFLTDLEKMKQDFANIPLVQGNSLVSDELCPSFLEEFSTVNPSLWYSKEALSNTTLQSIRTFCENCQKRKDMSHS